MNTGLSVADAMTTKPVTVRPDEQVSRVAKLMKSEHLGSVIVTVDSKIVGIVTEQDIVYKIVARDQSTDTPVEQIMSANVITIEPQQDILDAAVKMNKLNVRRLPVVRDNQVVGMLTMKDILKVEPELFQLMVDKIDLREEQRKPIHRVRDREGVCNICGNYAPFLFEQDDVMVCIDCKE